MRCPLWGLLTKYQPYSIDISFKPAKISPMSFDERTKAALQANEKEAWKDWRNYDNKMTLNKALIVALHGLELFGLGIVFLQTSNPLLCLGVPALIGINSVAMSKMDDKATKYWLENWMRPFRTIHEDPSRMVIDVDSQDATPRLRDRNE